jgi:hypothetical protein
LKNFMCGFAARNFVPSAVTSAPLLPLVIDLPTNSLPTVGEAASE